MPQSLSTIVMVVALGAAFYFLLIRPARRQQAKQAELLNSIGEGDRVMLGSGIFGTVRHMGTKQAVIELAPGVDVTVLKQAISRPIAADEEEFEYADEDDLDGSDLDEADDRVTAEADDLDLSDPDQSDADASDADESDEDESDLTNVQESRG